MKVISELKFKNSLETVYIDAEEMNFTGFQLIKSLFDLKSLTNLDLNNIIIGKENVEYLANSLKNDSNLVSLYVDGKFKLLKLN